MLRNLGFIRILQQRGDEASLTRAGGYVTRVLDRIVPLAPDLAVRIRPDLATKKLRGDLSFSAFRSRTIIAKNDVVCAMNRATVQCAEELVFFRDQSAWVAPFLGKNRAFRLEPLTVQIPVAHGFMNVSTMRIKRII